MQRLTKQLRALAFNFIAYNIGDWRSKSLALPFKFSTTLDGFYFANCVLADVFFLFDFQHFRK
jgi:hypothetical protein